MADQAPPSRTVSDALRLLVVRRDNIGDLVCTTPLLHSLRQQFPKAWIGVLANSYNAPVLDGNRDVDSVFAYCKTKHTPGVGRMSLFAERLRLNLYLRSMRLDTVLVATPGARAERMGAMLGARRVLVRGSTAGRKGRVEFVAEDAGHEVQRTFALGTALGIQGDPPAVRVFTEPSVSIAEAPFTLGIHISARKPSQRWPVERFAAVVRMLDPRWRIRLLWAPGDQDDPKHPGDDRKAAALLQALGDRGMEAFPTHSLRALVDALAGCHAVLCSDGGAMHLAAGMVKPLVCLFGDSDAARWHPWGPPYILLQPPSRHVIDVSASAVVEAVNTIAAAAAQKTTPGGHPSVLERQ